MCTRWRGRSSASHRSPNTRAWRLSAFGTAMTSTPPGASLDAACSTSSPASGRCSSECQKTIAAHSPSSSRSGMARTSGRARLALQPQRLPAARRRARRAGFRRPRRHRAPAQAGRSHPDAAPADPGFAAARRRRPPRNARRSAGTSSRMPRPARPRSATGACSRLRSAHTGPVRTGRCASGPSGRPHQAQGRYSVSRAVRAGTETDTTVEANRVREPARPRQLPRSDAVCQLAAHYTLGRVPRVTAKRSRLALAALPVGLALLLAAWIVATPPWTAPDEASHYQRAMSIANGRILGPKLDYTNVPGTPTQLRFIDHDTRGVDDARAPVATRRRLHEWQAGRDRQLPGGGPQRQLPTADVLPARGGPARLP